MGSAGAVRQGRVFVEIGADSKGFFAELQRVNARIGSLGDTLRSVGLGMTAVGAAIAGPIMALGGAFVEQTGEMLAMKRALADVGRAVGEAVAPAFVGMANVVAGAARAVAKFIRENQHLVRLAVVIGGYFAAWGSVTVAVGVAMRSLSMTIAASIGPLKAFTAWMTAAGTSLAAFATSGPVLAAIATLGGLAVGAAAAGVDLVGLAKIIGGAFGNPVAGVIALFRDLGATASLTIEGIYRAISAGDLQGAVDVLWAGWQASWARGQQAVMGGLDPWIAAMQNVFSDFGMNVAAWWDQTWTNIATSDWGGYLLGALDNYVNSFLATWDYLIGNLQKGWARLWNSIGRMTDEQLANEIARVNAVNDANAAQRGRERPGFAGRTGLTDEQKARMQQESKDRQAAMFAEAERLREERAKRTADNVRDRAAAVKQANANLRAQVDRFPVPPPVAVPAQVKTETVGSFSAFGLGQLGTKTIDKQQLDELKRIREELQRAARVGGIGP